VKFEKLVQVKKFSGMILVIPKNKPMLHGKGIKTVLDH
jgi:hypothetical protein